MARVLHVSASPRGDQSKSRQAGREFLAAWAAAHPADTVTDRDVGRHPPGHVTELWVQAAYAPPDQQTAASKAAIRESDELVDELLAHDVIVVSTPMYNFGVPSALKAWIDNVVRVGRTFATDPSKPNPYVPLVHGKKMFALIAAGGGGYAPGGKLAGLNYEDGYLKAIFGFMGITESRVMYFENAAGAPDKVEAEFTKTKTAIHDVVGA